MTARKRFLLGGLGALMPVLLSFLAIDVSAAMRGTLDWSSGEVMGTALRYLVLFAIGGVVAYLHSDESKPFKLFELGIVAPALVTSLVTTQGVNAALIEPQNNQTMRIELSLVSAAYAQEKQSKPAGEKSSGKFLQDVFSGLTGKVYRDIKKPEKKSSVDKEASED